MNFMTLFDIHPFLVVIQRSISLLGTLIILSGVLVALYHYIFLFFQFKKIKTITTKQGVSTQQSITLNTIRYNLARTLLLGLEFIVAADLIGTTTTPDYYSLGILASIVLIRTFLNWSLNRELVMLSKES